MEKVFSNDGTPIAYNRSGQGPTLILVHGTSVDHTCWSRVQGPLGAKSTLFLIDRRGRGESGDNDSYQIEREFEDIAAVANSITGSVVLLGHSFGGICALEATLKINRLRGLILYEPPILLESDIYREEIVRNMKWLMQTGDKDGVAKVFVQEVLRFPPDQIEQLRASPIWRGAVATAHTIIRELEVNGAQYKFNRDRFINLDIPVLLLLGGDSPEFYQRSTSILEQALPNSRVVVFPGQKHTAMVTAPDLFVQEVVAFQDGL
jgi:pimeloyl-ACP methyl ester carboxylesterase